MEASNIYKWEQVIVSANHSSDCHHHEISRSLSDLGFPSSSVLSLPVYISLTSISSRINMVNSTIISLLQGLIRPTHIFVFISKESYLLDAGVSMVPQELLLLAAAKYVTIVYTNNIGPHRKLLPLLSRYWNDDCIIVNVDDDMGVVRKSMILYQLLRYYMQSGGKSVVALRVRRMGICDSEPFEPTKYFTWAVYLSQTGRKEMLLLPTGTGGVLYRPRFFHNVIFDKRFRYLTGTADDLMFRLACMANNISVVIACKDLRYGSRQVRKCPASMAFFDSYQPGQQKEELQQVDYVEEVRNESLLHSLSVSLTREDLEQQLQDTIVRRQLKDTPSGGKNSSRHSNNSSAKVKQKKKSTTSTTSLFDINKRNKNDIQWNFAQRYLKFKKVMDLHDVVRRHFHEREKHCYSPGKQRSKWDCSLLACPRHDQTATKRRNVKNSTLVFKNINSSTIGQSI